MLVATNGIVVNQYGQVLLIRRNDTRTWAIPGGALEAGELPTDGVARELEEETGLQVTAARLVGLYYWKLGADDYLIFSFRCLEKGGDLRPSEESPQVGYAPFNALPRSLLAMHRERLEHGLSHDGGPPYWGRQEASRKLVFARKTVGRLVYGWMDLRRRLKGQPTYKAPKPWRIGAFVVLRDQGGEILWVKRGDYDVWNLPGGRAECDEAPWETAVRETREETGLAIRLTHLSGVYVKPVENTMVFTFIAEAIGGQLTTGLESVEFGRFPPGQEPVNSLPKHITRVADASSSQGTTVFRIQDGPPGLELLGLM